MAAEPQPSSLPAARFRCEVSREADTVRIRALGDLDMAAAPVLDAEIAALREAGTRSVVLDLTALRFLDSSGLRCILDGDAALRRCGVPLRLLPGPPAVQRVFELTGTHTYLPFVER